jgi:hypothetical protein
LFGGRFRLRQNFVDQFDGRNDDNFIIPHVPPRSDLSSIAPPPLTPAIFLLLYCSAKWRPPRLMPRLSLFLF